ncbi:AAA ATPase domain-containing protein [Micromonospora nigra]|uniref:AAA ATPase domain-containing protein n=1 Tax=Micromonospora nigra TaxID=145857 RepID=A0A1C6SIN7_9ACTN|nr:AAA family ATPase [Micromonospora nigra]SCL29225.1 AAA ATPase domain-containing protein [Micromonospora nigra]
MHSLPATLTSAERVKLNRWWNQPIGQVRPVLALTGPPCAEKTQILDDFALSVVTMNRTVAEPARVQWARLSADGSFASSAEDPAAAFDGLLATAEESAGAPGRRMPQDSAVRSVRIVLVDDDEQLGAQRPDLAIRLLRLVADPDRLDQAGLRVVVGCRTAVAPAASQSMAVPYIHARNDLLDRIGAWAGDPRDEPVLLVRGRPGTGKTRLLAEAARRLDRRTDLRVAYTLLRDATRPRPLGVPELVAGFARAFAQDGLSFGDARSDPVLLANVQVGTAHHKVVGIQVNEVSLPPSSATMAVLRAQLEQRVAAGRAETPLLLVVDGINELAETGSADFAELRNLLIAPDELMRWNVKVLLSGHDAVDVPTATLDLDGEDKADIHSYAVTRLTYNGVPEQTADLLADRLVELSNGLFIVASGYLDEIESVDPLAMAGWLSTATPVTAAADYFVAAVRRLLDGIEAGQAAAASTTRIDVERFLRILALTRQGMTSAELAAVWQATPNLSRISARPPCSSWEHVSATIGEGPERRYIVPPEDPATDRFRLLHPTLREALLRYPRRPGGAKPTVPALQPPYEAIGLTAERLRFLTALTPLYGQGPGWDPTTGRLALAETLSVVHDLAEQALDDSPDEAVIAECHRLLGLLFEDWEWIETCVRHAREHDPITLGLGVVIDGLGRLVRLANFDTDQPILWRHTSGSAADPDDIDAGPRSSGFVSPGAHVPTPRPTTGRTGRPFYASVEMARVAEVVNGYERRATREEAQRRLAELAMDFTPSRIVPPDMGPDERVLWIRGYSLHPREVGNGYLGNYARLSVRQLADGSWTIAAEKLAVDLARHPQKGRRAQAQAHPNWHHPILVRVKGNPRDGGRPQRYASYAQAQAELVQLKREYPTTSILNDGLLFLMVYDRRQQPVVRKFRLEIQAAGEKSYVIAAYPNDRPEEASSR